MLVAEQEQLLLHQQAAASRRLLTSSGYCCGAAVLLLPGVLCPAVCQYTPSHHSQVNPSTATDTAWHMAG